MPYHSQTALPRGYVARVLHYVGLLKATAEGNGTQIPSFKLNHIPGMYYQKNYLCSLVIEQEEWDHLSDPTYLAHYWEPTQEQGDFHRTFALVLCLSQYSDCEDESRREEYVVSVAIIWKPSPFARIPFALAADELSDPTKKNPILLIV